jgi:ribosomal protein L11 methyltransferase
VTHRKFSRLIIPRKAKDDALAGLLWLHGPLGLAEEGQDLVACFRDAGQARAARAVLESRGYRAKLSTDIPEGDPLEAFRKASRPFAVGRRLWIDPGEPKAVKPPASRIALRVPASRAFGTGGHASTRLALLALEEEVRPESRVLDAGTGSGILALAAAALGAGAAVGFDTDSDAVFVARRNCVRQSFGRGVALFAGEVSALAGKFSIVVANMLPDEFLPLLPALASRLDAAGRLILSGIPAEREEEIARRARGRRLRLSSRYREDDWSCLCLTRGSS